MTNGRAAVSTPTSGRATNCGQRARHGNANVAVHTGHNIRAAANVAAGADQISRRSRDRRISLRSAADG